MCLSKEGFETEVKSHSEHWNRFPVQTRNNSSYCYLSSLCTSANFCQHFGDVEYTVRKDTISDRAECTYLHRCGSICGFSAWLWIWTFYRTNRRGDVSLCCAGSCESSSYSCCGLRSRTCCTRTASNLHTCTNTRFKRSPAARQTQKSGRVWQKQNVKKWLFMTDHCERKTSANLPHRQISNFFHFWEKASSIHFFVCLCSHHFTSNSINRPISFHSTSAVCLQSGPSSWRTARRRRDRWRLRWHRNQAFKHWRAQMCFHTITVLCVCACLC